MSHKAFNCLVFKNWHLWSPPSYNKSSTFHSLLKPFRQPILFIFFITLFFLDNPNELLPRSLKT
ncbi:hypothetical protein GBA52_027129 [Prunus armeniaca]|nr:hypothetical protein GBA52_027129 [Prunus armeniaca]